MLAASAPKKVMRPSTPDAVGAGDRDHAQRQKDGQERDVGNRPAGPGEREQPQEARPASGGLAAFTGGVTRAPALSIAAAPAPPGPPPAGRASWSPRWASMISSTARDAVAAMGWSTAVRVGTEKCTIGVSSKLMIDRSAGTERPRSRATSSAAKAIWSLLAMIAVAGSVEAEQIARRALAGREAEIALRRASRAHRGRRRPSPPSSRRYATDSANIRPIR